jgi:hypothetical protein
MKKQGQKQTDQQEVLFSLLLGIDIDRYRYRFSMMNLFSWNKTLKVLLGFIFNFTL